MGDKRAHHPHQLRRIENDDPWVRSILSPPFKSAPLPSTSTSTRLSSSSTKISSFPAFSKDVDIPPTVPLKRTPRISLRRLSSLPGTFTTRSRTLLVVMGLAAILLALFTLMGLKEDARVAIRVTLESSGLKLLGTKNSDSSASLSLDVNAMFTTHPVVVFRVLRNVLPKYETQDWVLAWLETTLKTETPREITVIWVIYRIIDKKTEMAMTTILQQNQQIFKVVPFNHSEYRAMEPDFQALLALKYPLDFLSSSEYNASPIQLQLDIWFRVFHQHDKYLQNTDDLHMAATRKAITLGSQWVSVLDSGVTLGESEWRAVTSLAHMAGNGTSFLALPVERDPFVDYSPSYVARDELINAMGKYAKPAVFWRTKTHWKPDLEKYSSCSWYGKVQARHKQKFPILRDRKTIVGPNIRLAIPVPESIQLDWVNTRREGACVRHRQANMALIKTALTLSFLEKKNVTEDTLVSYDENILEAEKRDFQNVKDTNHIPSHNIHTVVNKIIACADIALAVQISTVVNKTETPSKNIHDYYSIKPYWWPTGNTENDFVQKDGKRRPDSQLWAEGSEKFDRSRLQSVFGNVTCLALAHYFTGSSKYSSKGAEIIRTWFIDENHRMSPTMEFAQWKPGPTASHSAIVDFIPFFHFLDSIRLISRSGDLSINETIQIRHWAKDLLDSMNETRQNQAGHHRNNIGIYHSLLSVSLNSFAGNHEDVIMELLIAKGRMMGQISHDGQLINELDRANWRHYTLYALQGWYDLAQAATGRAMDLWTVTLPGRIIPLLCRAAHANTPYFDTDILRLQSESFVSIDAARFQPIVQLAHRHCGGFKLKDNKDKDISQPEIPTLYESDSFVDLPIYGVAPFWMLGLSNETYNGSLDLHQKWAQEIQLDEAQEIESDEHEESGCFLCTTLAGNQVASVALAGLVVSLWAWRRLFHRK